MTLPPYIGWGFPAELREIQKTFFGGSEIFSGSNMLLKLVGLAWQMHAADAALHRSLASNRRYGSLSTGLVKTTRPRESAMPRLRPKMVRRRDVSQGANRVYEVTTDQNRTTSRSNS